MLKLFPIFKVIQEKVTWTVACWMLSGCATSIMCKRCMGSCTSDWMPSSWVALYSLICNYPLNGAVIFFFLTFRYCIHCMQTLGTNVANLLWLHWPPVLLCLFFNLAKLQCNCKQTVVTDFCIGFCQQNPHYC